MKVSKRSLHCCLNGYAYCMVLDEHRITELLRLKKTSGVPLLQTPPPQSMVSYRGLPRAMSNYVLNTTTDSTASLGNLFQCLTTLMECNFFVLFRSNTFWFVPVASYPFAGHHREDPVSVFFPTSHLLFIDKNPLPEPSLLWAEQSWLY